MYGISGAALSTLISFVIYNMLVIFIVYRKMKVYPFSIEMLKIVALTVVLLVFNYLIPLMINPYIEIVVRGLLSSGIFILVAYYWKISMDTNHVIQMFINRLKQYVIH
jgi:Na+-driven multidrug efflux pump